MWKEISQIISDTDKKVKLTHVKGHNGNHGNEVADELAESAARIYRGERVMLSIASFLLSMLLGLLFLFIIEFGILKPYKQWKPFLITLTPSW